MSTGKIFKCPTCNILWVEDQVLLGQNKQKKDIFLCPQDHSIVEDITNTERGKRFAALYKSWEEGKNADQI